jgi:hypothetical protein
MARIDGSGAGLAHAKSGSSLSRAIASSLALPAISRPRLAANDEMDLVQPQAPRTPCKHDILDCQIGLEIVHCRKKQPGSEQYNVLTNIVA